MKFMAKYIINTSRRLISLCHVNKRHRLYIYGPFIIGPLFRKEVVTNGNNNNIPCLLYCVIVRMEYAKTSIKLFFDDNSWGKDDRFPIDILGISSYYSTTHTNFESVRALTFFALLTKPRARNSDE